MDDRAAQRSGYPLKIPDTLLNSDAMRQACAARNFQEIFRLMNRRTGSSHAVTAAAIGRIPSSRVSDIIRGVRGIRGSEVIEHVADGFGIPGGMLGLAARPWQSSGNLIQSSDEIAIDSQRKAQQGKAPSVDRRAFVSTTAAVLSVAATQMNRGQRVIQALIAPDGRARQVSWTLSGPWVLRPGSCRMTRPDGRWSADVPGCRNRRCFLGCSGSVRS